jgi:phospholipid/cholesterol/gamma-HCH transport system ATP-binding protein
VIELKNVYKSFGDNTILRNISLKIPPRQTTAIIGPSGTGKSVTLKHIVGLLRPDKGQVMCFGTDMATASQAELYKVRRRFGMLFQDGALFDSFSVGENVCFPLVHHATEMEGYEHDTLIDAIRSRNPSVAEI